MSDDNRIVAEPAEHARLADGGEHDCILAELAELRASLNFVRNYIEEQGEHLEIIPIVTVKSRERVGILKAQLASLSRRIDQLFALMERRSTRRHSWDDHQRLLERRAGVSPPTGAPSSLQKRSG